MKTAVIFLRKASDNFDFEYCAKVNNVLNSGGVSADSVIILSQADDITFKRNLIEFTDTVDNLIVIGGEKAEFDLKKMVAECFDSVLVENESAKTLIEAVKGKVDDVSDYALMPMEATLIPNALGVYQGFVFNQDEFSLIVLPSVLSELKPMCEKFVIPYFESKYGINSKRLTLKYFGDSNKLFSVIDKVKKERGDNFTVNVSEKYGDFTVDLLFKNTDALLSKDVIRDIVFELKEDIYAEFDTSLSERLFDLLKLKNLKISTAESFTAGRVVSSIISNAGVSNYLQEGVVSYSNLSKVKRLGVIDNDLKKDGAVSSIVAYQMALGLLKTGDCDIAISTTGIAGPKSDDTIKPVGLCYIGIGMKNGVHTYRYNFTGTREEITETAKNTALFLAIKNLKNI